jgi:hypothetical protein
MMTTTPRHPFGRDNTALIFGSVEDFFSQIFGPAQHDAHVQCWRSDKFLTSREAHAAAANLRCSKLVDEIAEGEAQKLARVNDYSVLNLRSELYRWECGFMRGDRFAGPRVRQLRRALEIAAAHSAETRMEAAE